MPDTSTKDTYNNLPDTTKEFLKNLRQEDIDQITQAIHMSRTVQTMGRVMKWISITIVAAFVGAASLGDAVMKLKAWFATGALFK